jgi:hypothetical protein
MCKLCKKVSKAFYGHNKKSNVTKDTFETKEVQEEKEMDYRLESFPYFTQTDNKLFSSTTCYPTSMAMTIKWCLKIASYSEYEIGCPLSMQLEDYITQITESKETNAWIKRNVSKYGNWMLNYKPRTLAYVEEYVFNKLMNPLGFKARFSANITYKAYCKHLSQKKMPIVLHGDFSTISPVAGHIVCGVGFRNDDNSVICHDPFGNALLDKYKSHEDGEYAIYPVSLVMKDKKRNRMWGQIIERI